MEISEGSTKKYKVTKRVPELSVSETKVYKSKEKAKRKFDEWLR